jgi:hypothetical protein
MDAVAGVGNCGTLPNGMALTGDADVAIGNARDDTGDVGPDETLDGNSDDATPSVNAGLAPPDCCCTREGEL